MRIKIRKENKKMARPKSTNPIKGRLNLTVSEQTRLNLEFLSMETGLSVSQLVANFAEKETKKLAKAKGKQVPDINQLKMQDV